MPKSKPRVRLTPEAYDDLKRLRGNTRRQIIKAVDGLSESLRPPHSTQLLLPHDQREVRRLRHNGWRIIYLIVDEQAIVLGIRRRPPYNYDDLSSLLDEAE